MFFGPGDVTLKMCIKDINLIKEDKMRFVGVVFDGKLSFTYHYGEMGIPKGTDTFQTFIIKKLDNLRKKFHIIKTSIKCHFFKNFGKPVKLNFNGLTGVNS